MTQPQPRRGGFIDALLGSTIPDEWHNRVLDVTRHITLTAIWGATGIAVIFLALLVCWAAVLTAVRLPGIL